MTRMRRTLLVSLGVTALSLAIYCGMSMLLDRSDLMPRLLSPTGDGFIPVALLGLSFFVLRLTLLFVLPGAVLTRLILAVAARVPDLRRAKVSRRKSPVLGLM